MNDTLIHFMFYGFIVCFVVFALLAAIGILFYFSDKFIIYIIKKVRERHKKDDEFEIR